MFSNTYNVTGQFPSYSCYYNVIHLFLMRSLIPEKIYLFTQFYCSCDFYLPLKRQSRLLQTTNIKIKCRLLQFLFGALRVYNKKGGVLLFIVILVINIEIDKNRC